MVFFLIFALTSVFVAEAALQPRHDDRVVKSITLACDDEIDSLCWSADGHYLIAGSCAMRVAEKKPYLHLWRVEGLHTDIGLGRHIPDCSWTMPLLGGRIIAIAVSANNTTLAAGIVDNEGNLKVLVWRNFFDGKGGMALNAADLCISLTKRAKSVSMAFSHDGLHLAIGVNGPDGSYLFKFDLQGTAAQMLSMSDITEGERERLLQALTFLDERAFILAGMYNRGRDFYSSLNVLWSNETGSFTCYHQRLMNGCFACPAHKFISLTPDQDERDFIRGISCGAELQCGQVKNAGRTILLLWEMRVIKNSHGSSFLDVQPKYEYSIPVEDMPLKLGALSRDGQYFVYTVPQRAGMHILVMRP